MEERNKEEDIKSILEGIPIARIDIVLTENGIGLKGGRIEPIYSQLPTYAKALVDELIEVVVEGFRKAGEQRTEFEFRPLIEELPSDNVLDAPVIEDE